MSPIPPIVLFKKPFPVPSEAGINPDAHRWQQQQCTADNMEVEVPYVTPFAIIKSDLDLSTVKGELRVTLSYEKFIEIIKQLLVGVSVDETWYLERYRDVADAIRAGETKSARAHFVEHGYVEGRLPAPIEVDEQWYLEQNPDVLESVRQGTEVSAQAHFDRHGYAEGRQPFAL